ncbi:2-hydroxy-3-oxopropionate reductase [plant metagenome]|uniref:2-hydroxy-3-oxopropionate reductase n=1 Tax=plant metagenome TaxID=1297885 RepID=A0A484QW88_9ZZZZ
MSATQSSSPVRVGFIGLGVMGRGMAGSLLRAGHAVTVFNRNAQAMPPLVEQGAQAADSIAALGASCRVVFLCLSDTAAVEAVLFGEGGLAQALAAGSTVIDTSTISAPATRGFAARLAERGVAMLDSPVSGGQQGAATGSLSCMVGGDAAVFAACLPYLQAIGSKVAHVGGIGAGQVVKACNQVAVTGVMLGVAEAFALARRHDVAPAVVREALLGGAARSMVLEKNALRLIERDFQPGFKAELMRKDLRLALQAGQDRGVFMPGAALIAQLLEGVCSAGEGGLDWSALGKLVETLSGVEEQA